MVTFLITLLKFDIKFLIRTCQWQWRSEIFHYEQMVSLFLTLILLILQPMLWKVQ